MAQNCVRISNPFFTPFYWPAMTARANLLSVLHALIFLVALPTAALTLAAGGLCTCGFLHDGPCLGQIGVDSVGSDDASVGSDAPLLSLGHLGSGGHYYGDGHDHSLASGAFGISGQVTGRMDETPSAGDAFFFRNRWTITATDGDVGNVRGTPVTLTWNVVPDGTPIGINAANNQTSNLIEFLDSTVGNANDASITGTDITQKSWFSTIESSYARWGAVSGLDFVYEPADDSAQVLASVATRGELGVRADLRLAGAAITAAAVNVFPNGGDGVINSDAPGFFSNPFNLRNVLAHEIGHGLGIQHIESLDSTFLLNPSNISSIDGPQLSDILAVQRNYGDALEVDGGNDTVMFGTSIGSFSRGDTFAIGTDADAAATLLEVLPGQTDFVSIDGASDSDFFVFSVDQISQLEASLTQVGAVFSSRPQNANADFTEVDTRALAFLDLEVFEVGPNDSLISLGVSGSAVDFKESLSGLTLLPGVQYAAQVRNSSADFDNVQLYRLDLDFQDVTAIPEPAAATALLMICAAGAVRRRRRLNVG